MVEDRKVLFHKAFRASFILATSLYIAPRLVSVKERLKNRLRCMEAQIEDDFFVLREFGACNQAD